MGPMKRLGRKAQKKTQTKSYKQISEMEPKLTKYWFVIYVLAALLILGGFLNLGIHLGPKLEIWLLAKRISSRPSALISVTIRQEEPILNL